MPDFTVGKRRHADAVAGRLLGHQSEAESTETVSWQPLPEHCAGEWTEWGWASLRKEAELVSSRFHAMRSGKDKNEAASAPATTTSRAGEDSVPPALAQIHSVGDNAINLPLLVQQLKTRVGVVPFVGAGMSVPFGFPAWRPFLEAQAPDDTARQQIRRLLDDGQYEEAAEALLAARGNNAFQTVLEDTFGEDRLPKPLPAAAILQLPRLCSGPVLTTNFDAVLEKVFDDARRPFEERILGMKVDALEKAFLHSRRVLVKLHGDAGDRTDRVLTLSDYERAYGKREPLTAFLRFAMTRPLLFLGCSLGQDRTVRVLEGLAGELRGQGAEGLQVHYAIVEQPRDDADFKRRNRRLTDLGIRPVWYPTGQHWMVEPLLAHLAAEAKQAEPSDSLRPAMPPEKLPYLCDRSAQEEELRTLLETVRDRPGAFQRPIVCVVHGAMGEAHGEFLQRLQARFVPRCLRDLGLNGRVEFLNLKQCPTAQDAAGFGRQFRRLMAEDLDIRPCESDPQLVEGFADRRASLLAPVLSLTHREAFAAAPDSLELTHDYWASFPDLPPGLILITFVSIKHLPEDPPAKPGLLRSLFTFGAKAQQPPPSPQERIKAFSSRSGGSDARVICAALPELQSIRFEDVNRWLQTTEVTSCLQQQIKDEQILAIFRDHPSRPMQTVIDKLTDLISAQSSRHNKSS